MSNVLAAWRTCSMRDLTARRRSALASTSSQASIEGLGMETAKTKSVKLLADEAGHTFRQGHLPAPIEDGAG